MEIFIVIVTYVTIFTFLIEAIINFNPINILIWLTVLFSFYYEGGGNFNGKY